TEINIVEKKQQGQNEFSFTLKPKFGSLTINTTDEFKGAKIFIDEEDKGQIPITIDFIKAGTHKLLIKKNLYANYETSFEMKEGDKKIIPNITLTPLFGLLSITTQPDNANIYLNKKKLGVGKISNYKLNSGQYELEVNADDYKPISKTIQLLENQQYTDIIRLERQVGKIDINTFPTGCEIFLNGKKQDLLSPVIFRNIPVGNYEVEIKKQGYNNLKKNITVLDEQTTKINEPLINTKKIKIETQPSGATILLNNTIIGISPLEYEFNLNTNYTITAKKTDYEVNTQHIYIYESTKNVFFNLKQKSTVDNLPNTDIVYFQGEQLLDEQGRLLLDKQGRPLLNNFLNIEMVYVQGGTFTMGCTAEQGSDCDDEAKPAHQVTLSSYYIGKYEVTQELWRKFIESTGYITDADKKGGSYFANAKKDDVELRVGVNWEYDESGNKLRQDYNPVIHVSWNDCEKFIEWLNKQTGKHYRLPTESEWEYAARGGNKSRGYKYSGGNDLGTVAWYSDNSGSKTHSVGTKQSNELGIFDMSGNVMEWCGDWYGDYNGSAITNPTGANSGSKRVVRGSCWLDMDIGDEVYLVSYRGGIEPFYRFPFIGLRLVLAP
ncbi:MAG: formylglycine-generating enzyme family protein, partial [Sediminibacterium sp.]|nr:formylglycine-generating enzyme family protein [Sediminibacterium sp.]